MLSFTTFLHKKTGLLSVASCSFLIPITQRQQVAQVYGRPIYAVTNVALIPTSSQADATRAISQAKASLLQDESGPGETAEEDYEEISDGSDPCESDTDISNAEDLPPTGISHSRGPSVSSIAEEVIGKRVRFGKFAASWLSKKALGLSGLNAVGAQDTDHVADNKKAATSPMQTATQILPDVSSAEGQNTPASVPDVQVYPSLQDGKAAEGSTSIEETVELLPKLLRYTKLIFASQNFFFAYDYDITHPIGVLESQKSTVPLYKVVDPLVCECFLFYLFVPTAAAALTSLLQYFWNRHLMNAFIEYGAHNFVLPLMQGFVGQKEFAVSLGSAEADGHVEGQLKALSLSKEGSDTEADDSGPRKRNFLLTLISRRSIKRPGLRYLRRGVDDDGNTANTVETEQILSAPDWNPAQNIYSFLQIRGSIPLYFSQSPYAFKPVPVLHHSVETNQLAFDKHFRELGRRYGKVQAVSLIDKHGGELDLGQQYDKYAQELNASGGINGSPLGLEWFDFHEECRGMKFENVKRLVDVLRKTLEDYSDTVIHGNNVVRKQAGIVRTNCMDCLDRTGVAQCAFGQWALEQELRREGIDIDLHNDISTQWFNVLWADSGDAISKQYSSTAALKGDYTRTRKRDYRGALHDLGLTLSRYFNNAVNDYFSQACIDYLLGNVSTQVFKEFELEMQSVDPGISVDRLRQNAIDTSCQIVISEQSEEFLGGWTMLTPRQPNTLRSLPMEESVLLLTDAAVYTCRFDWNTDKVLSFERIDLRSITRINYGTYITSILTEAQMDEKTNVGLVIVHGNGDENSLRVNTRSLQSSVNLKMLDNTASRSSPANEWDIYSWFKSAAEAKKNSPSFVAFKALPLCNSATIKNGNRSGSVPGNISELDFVRSICEEIERATSKVVSAHGGPEVGKLSMVGKTDIITLEDAKKRTGYLEHLFYDIKKLVWA